MQGLYPIGEYKELWDRESLQFFCAVFRKSALTKGFDYGNKFRRDIAEKLVVLLPIDEYRNPNWDYMKNYIKQVEFKVKESLLELEKAIMV